MPIYSSSFFSELIEPVWRVLVQEVTLYCRKVVFNEEFEFSEQEKQKLSEEGFEYSRGYESESEDEVFGIEGFILELIDLTVDLLKRQGMMEALQDHMLTLFLCLKSYSLLKHEHIILWKNDPNLFISEEYDDENINSIRIKAIGLIKEVSKEIDDSILLNFIKIVISEFFEGTNPENYLDVIKLDDYNFLFPYLEQMNSDKNYIERRHESNLLILGNLADDISLLKNKNKISDNDFQSLIQFLFDLISNCKIYFHLS
jgi:hypothetical protein